MIRSWTKAQKWRQAVAHGNAIDPKPSSPSVTVGEWVDANPLRMGPRAQSEDGLHVVSVQILIGLDHFIQCSDRPLELLVEFSQLSLYIGCVDSKKITDLDIVIFESGFTPESSHQPKNWRDKPLHDNDMPETGDLDRQRLPAEGLVSDEAKYLGEVAAELGRVVVPVSH